MATKRAAKLMSTALIYAQGALMVAAVAAVIARLPADEQKATTALPQVAAVAFDTIAR
ncbi:MAG: hypothetical protein KF723_20730 [Rhizobiaceae bacterium]|nr:hypothetical protein [Rhizobiaceae bacterium]